MSNDCEKMAIRIFYAPALTPNGSAEFTKGLIVLHVHRSPGSPNEMLEHSEKDLNRNSMC